MTTALARPAAAEPLAIKRDAVALTFEAAREQIIPLIPKGETLERVIATVQLAIANEPKLAGCTPQSLFTGTCRVLQWGLEIGTTAYLVPFGNTATAIADYKGLAELIVASGCARAVQAFCVYEGEHFIYVQGTEAKIEHIPSRESEGRVKMLGSYCVIRLPFQQSIFDFFPMGEIDAVRRKYSHSWKSGPCPPWWAKKYAIRQVAKTLPKSPRIKHVRGVIDEDEAAEALVAPAAEVRPSAPALAAAPAVAASPAFEEQETRRQRPVLDINLPNWKDHPLAGKPIREISNDDLGTLVAQLRDAGGLKYALLRDAIDAELDARREEPA